MRLRRLTALGIMAVSVAALVGARRPPQLTLAYVIVADTRGPRNDQSPDSIADALAVEVRAAFNSDSVIVTTSLIEYAADACKIATVKSCDLVIVSESLATEGAGRQGIGVSLLVRSRRPGGHHKTIPMPACDSSNYPFVWRLCREMNYPAFRDALREHFRSAQHSP
jgi:hypothetical protein